MHYRAVLAAFLFGLSALAIWVGYSFMLRLVLLPTDLKYVPADSGIVGVSGPISNIWDGVKHHFDRILNEPDREGMLAQTLLKISDLLKESEIEISNKTDLEEHGIDIANGVTFAVTDDAFVVVVPSSDGEAITKLLTTVFDEEPDKHDCRDEDGVLDGVKAIGRMYVAYPEEASVLVSNSCDFLRRSLHRSDQNLAFMRSDLGFYDVLRRQLNRPLHGGAGLVIYARNIPQGVSDWIVSTLGGESVETEGRIPIDTTMGFALDLLPEQITASLHLGFNRFRLRTLNNILAKPNPVLPWQQFVDQNHATMLVVRDTHLPEYLDAIQEKFDLQSSRFGSILTNLSKSAGLRQLVVSTTGITDGLPGIIFGIWGDDRDLDTLVFNTQQDLRNARDQIVLTKALASETPTPSGETTGSSATDEITGGASDSGLALANQDSNVKALIESGKLVAEPGLWLRRFSILEGSPRLVRELVPADFEKADYMTSFEGHDIRSLKDATLRYLEPEFTVNDLKYRVDNDALDESGRALLLSNRYRLSSVRRSGVLWISSDQEQLKKLIHRWDGTSEGENVTPTYRRKIRDLDPKIELSIDTLQLIEQGLLSEVQGIHDVVEDLLLDLRYHEDVALMFNGDAKEQEARLLFTAYRRSGAR